MIGRLPKTVARRAVFFIGGYDPKSADAFFDRLKRETGRFETLWDIETEAGPLHTLSGDTTRMSFKSSGKDWKTHTDFHFLSLDDIVLTDFDRPFLQRLARYLTTFADYWASGTALVFLSKAWRFFIYFAYPFIMLLIAFVVSLVLGLLIFRSGVALSWLSAPVIFLTAFTAFVQLGGRKYHVLHLMDLWSFSRDYVRQRRHDISDKLDRYGATIAETVANGLYDEVVLVGHSTGGALMLDAAASAVEQDADLPSKTGHYTVLTVGSTAAKIGAHPAAQWYRDKLNALFARHDVHWVEYQCLTDIINFYKTDPAKLMTIKAENPPLVRTIKIRDMLDPDVYKRIKRNFFRIHYQFVFGNTRRYHYDFPAICFGPHTLIDRAKRK